MTKSRDLLCVPVGPVRTLIDELFAEIEDPIDGRRGWPDFEVIEVVVGAVEDRAVLVGGPRRKLPRGRQPRRFGMAGPVGPQRLVQHGRRGTSSCRRVRARRRRRQRRDDGRWCG